MQKISPLNQRKVSVTTLCHQSISQAIYVTSQSTSVILPIKGREYVKNCTSQSKTGLWPIQCHQSIKHRPLSPVREPVTFIIESLSLL
ncbi:hypothetical protein CEXT_591001 [Caerostris extrusa]|uniref:Uncharacterized protein n=1 Tax=Caerostris extrusa TaxID=172846 RepID=A0AAV4SIZ0_CAEEX|nr:hypothetical protein CEXT_591001 [Caerostris extrusa]